MNDTTVEKRQSLANLRGEVEFRAKLSTQHVTGQTVLPDYYRKDEHDRILLGRMEATRTRMQELADHAVQFSPFLELGAERGQRSLVLANDFGANGVAVDISYHQLRTMEHFAKLFNRERLPVRICCDANRLPFRSNAFPFIFGYEFLHHFPSITPITREIYRVMGNGYFYFDEEPFKRVLKLVLYRQRHKMYSKNALSKNKYVSLIESFISEPYSDEVEHGIVENDDIGLAEWIEALSIFDQREVKLVSINSVTSELDGRLRIGNLFNLLLGGFVSGLCRKTGAPAQRPAARIVELLGCPDCVIPSDHGEFDRPPLLQLADGLKCTQCGVTYPCINGIFLLLPKAEFEQLYPELLHSAPV